jgi:hypothetical protein
MEEEQIQEVAFRVNVSHSSSVGTTPVGFFITKHTPNIQLHTQRKHKGEGEKKLMPQLMGRLVAALSSKPASYTNFSIFTFTFL